MTTTLPHPNRLATFLVLGAALGLSGCLTPRVKPTISKAVLEARAHREAPAAAACPEAASPVSVGFGFGEARISELAVPAVDAAARLLACHPQVSALVVGQADGHGTPADQAALARGRAEAVAQALESRGLAAARISVQAQGSAPAGDATHLVVLAEGRRW